MLLKKEGTSLREFLIKTMKEEAYLHSFLQEGEMLLKHVEIFRNIEDNYLRGDKNEGMCREDINVLINPSVSKFYFGGKGGKVVGIDWDGVKKAHPHLANEGMKVLRITYAADVLIYCITYINSNTPNIDAVLSEIQRFGGYSAVITDCGDFISKIKAKIPNSQFGLVKYTDNDSKAPRTYNVFEKDKNYQSQQEFRIVKPSNGQRSEIIRIGKLSGFVCTSRSLDALKQLLIQ